MAPGHHGEIEANRPRRWHWAECSVLIQHREVALRAGQQLRAAQARREVGLARVGYTAGRQRIKRQRGAAHRREIAVDVEDHIGGVGDIDADGPWLPPGTMAALALTRPSSEFMVETTGWPSPVGQIVK